MLNVGLDMGVLSPTLFAMLVLMALVTTFTTTPVLNVIMHDRVQVDAVQAAMPDLARRPDRRDDAGRAS